VPLPLRLIVPVAGGIFGVILGGMGLATPASAQAPGTQPGQIERQFQQPPQPLPPFEAKAALFEDRDGKKLIASATAEVQLEPVKSYGRDIGLLATGTLVVTIGIVVLGLLAGAEDKIRSLDWWSAIVAIVVLGFSADTLKRILTKSQAQP